MFKGKNPRSRTAWQALYGDMARFSLIEKLEVQPRFYLICYQVNPLFIFFKGVGLPAAIAPRQNSRDHDLHGMKQHHWQDHRPHCSS